ncbi:MAG: T9SS type A sorting domain-containing protein [Panacibacter sp.]
MKTTSTILCCLFVIGMSFNIQTKAQAINVQDSLALVDLYNSTDGPHWNNNTNWLTGPVSTWYGVEFNSDVGAIIVVLGSNNLNGTIPSSIGNIVKLGSLAINNNNLNGAIPSSIGNLINLTNLNISSNQLSGAIPSSIGNLVNLTDLAINNNQLNGAIPLSIGNLLKLRNLKISNNQLSGAIPSSIGNLIELISFDINNNQLSNTIPSSIGNLVNLGSLNFNNNQLSGAIPSSIGNLVNLGSLNFNDNQLSGAIPQSIGNLTKVYNINISHNQLSGTIPSSIGNLIGLASFDISFNQISGSIPLSIGNLIKLAYLTFNNNQLNGAIPTYVGSLPLLSYVHLEYNQFKKINFSFDSLKNLTQLYLNDNQLSGEIPSSISKRTKLRKLYLQNNKFGGDVSIVANIATLRVADLSGNFFTFNGMELVSQDIEKIKYSHQATVPIHQNGNTLSVSAGGTLSNNTYRWFIVGQTDTTFIVGDSVFNPDQNGTYGVIITNVIATELIIKSKPINYIETTTIVDAGISPNNALQQDNNKNLFTVYPNPAKNILNVQTNTAAVFSLLRQDGKTVVRKNITGTGAINITRLSAGIYYLKNNNTGAVQKVMVIE